MNRDRTSYLNVLEFALPQLFEVVLQLANGAFVLCRTVLERLFTLVQVHFQLIEVVLLVREHLSCEPQVHLVRVALLRDLLQVVLQLQSILFVLADRVLVVIDAHLEGFDRLLFVGLLCEFVAQFLVQLHLLVDGLR